MSTEHETSWPSLTAGPTTAAGPATAAGQTRAVGSTTAIRPSLDWPDGQLSARANPVPAWLRFFNSELRLVFGRPRNLALLGVLVIAPVFFGVVLRLTLSSDGNGGFPFLNQLAGNGVFLALVVL